MRSVLCAALLVACAAASISAQNANITDAGFQQYNATLYLYGNQPQTSLWPLLPFNTTVTQVLWWEPAQFVLLFEGSQPMFAKVQADGTIALSDWPLPSDFAFGGVGAVRGSDFYYAAIWGAMVHSLWCDASLQCVQFNSPMPSGVTATVVLDADVLGPGSMVLGTDGGLVLLNFTNTSSSMEFVALVNTTGGTTRSSYISKVHVQEDGTILAASNTNYTTVNTWTTDLVHVVKGNQQVYFYRTPGIIDAVPTAFVPDRVRGGVHLGNIICDNFLSANGTLDRISGAYEGGLPQRNITSGVLSGSTDNVWFGTVFGVSMLRPDGSWKYFFGPRWLPGEGFTTGMAVQSLAAGYNPADGSEVVLVATDTGLSLIYTLSWTSLETKAAFYQSQMPRFLRFGLVSVLGLSEFGSTNNYAQQPTANDGLWTSLYLGSQSFRYAATGSSDAKQEAWNAFNGMQMLVNVTGDVHYPARNFIQHSLPCPSSYNPSPSLPGFCWNGGTSSDEIVGHLHGYNLFYHLVASTPEEKARVVATITNILGGIVKNNFTLIGAHGDPTHWGHWGPQDLNNDPFWYDERGVNSAQILIYLVTAYGITENEMFADAFWYLVDEAHYDENIIDLKITQPSDINFSDDELTFLPYLSFLFGEKFANGTINPLYQRLAPQMWKSIQRTHSIVAREKPSLYNAVYAAAAMQLAGYAPTESTIVRAVTDSQWFFRTYTVWQVDWPINNAARIDAVFPHNDVGRGGPGDGTTHTLTLFPYDEQTMLRWNSNPFRTQQGTGFNELDPSPFLYPFWVGRYFNLW